MNVHLFCTVYKMWNYHSSILYARFYTGVLLSEVYTSQTEPQVFFVQEKIVFLFLHQNNRKLIPTINYYQE